MEPWTQPTTAPHQPDVADDPSIDERAPLVERGWMEDVPARASAVVTWGRRRDSLAIDVFTAAVVIFFLFFAVFFFPLLLLRAG